MNTTTAFYLKRLSFYQPVVLKNTYSGKKQKRATKDSVFIIFDRIRSDYHTYPTSARSSNF